MRWRCGVLAAVAAGLSGCGVFQDIGAINGRWTQDAMGFEHAGAGKAQTSPVVLRIRVDAKAEGDMGYIGRLVHRDLFADRGPFTFNVAFASAEIDWLGRSAYADPGSIWYDVFFGMYEVDVPVTQGRPYGYVSAAADAGVNKREVMLLGLADWNYFSNHLYGVPIEAVRAIRIPADERSIVVHGRVRLPSGEGMTEWDDVEVTDIWAVGPGRSQGDRKDFEPVPHADGEQAPWWLQGVFQRAFGKAERAPAGVLSASFLPVRLQGRLWMFHDEGVVDGERVYRTFFAGGTAPYGDTPREKEFLQAQMEALKGVVGRERLGFGVAVKGRDGGG